MKHLIVLLFFLLPIKLLALEETRISIAPYIPENISELDAQSVKLLKSRMESVTSNNGISTIQNGSFAMIPSINVLSYELVEGGLRNIHQVELEITFCIKQQSTDIGFGTKTVTLKGHGFTYNGAIKEAISKITPYDKRFSDWFDTCKKKINDYYTSNCSQIITTAKAMAARGEYDKALAYLCSYPSSLDGYEEIVQAELSIYMDCVQRECTIMMNHAEAEYTKQNYEAAIAILSDIDPTCPCATDAKRKLHQIDSEIKAIQKAERDSIEREKAEQRQIIENQREREAQVRVARMGAIQNIASSFFSSLPSLVRVFF